MGIDNYMDYEAYGRDTAINENAYLGRNGYLDTRSAEKMDLNRYSKGELYTEAGVELPDEIRQKEEEREIDIPLKLKGEDRMIIFIDDETLTEEERGQEDENEGVQRADRPDVS